VKAYLKRDAVGALVPTYAPIPVTDTINQTAYALVQSKTLVLLRLSLSQVMPLYEVEKQIGFKAGGRRGIEFATARLATGAQFNPRHDRRCVARQRHRHGGLPDGQRARHPERQGQGDARADGRGLS
jgi:hypothetical protein